MKYVFALLLLIVSQVKIHAQAFPFVQHFAVVSDSMIVNGRVYDSDGNLSVSPYVGLFNSSLVADGYWVIQPQVDDVNTDSMRWVLLVRPKSKTVSTNTYTIKTDDFQKTINCTYAGARTITLPSVGSVNTTDPVWIKDAANNAGSYNVTIQSTDLIDGSSSVVINVNGGVLGIYKSGSTYKIQ